MLQFLKKLKLHKVNSKEICEIIHIKVYLFPIICIYYLSFFIIYLCNLKTKVFSTTGTSHWMTDLSVKSITGVTFAGKCPCLMYMICLLTYCFPFFSMIATLFDIAFSIFKLKDFNCFNSFVPLPFIKLGHLGTVSHTYGNGEAMHI